MKLQILTIIYLIYQVSAGGPSVTAPTSDCIDCQDVWKKGTVFWGDSSCNADVPKCLAEGAYSVGGSSVTFYMGYCAKKTTEPFIAADKNNVFEVLDIYCN